MVSKIINMIENGNPENCFVKSFQDGSRFYKDFIEMLNVFADNLCKKDYYSIERKVLEALETSDIQKYLQCMCEIVVLYYIIRYYGDNDFCYEPKYNGGFNPECSFEDGNYRVNIEVKTPNYAKRIEQEMRDSIKVFPAERCENHKEIVDDIRKIINRNSNQTVEELLRLDNKLKDFLIHSQKKFPCGEEYFNILVVAVDITSDVDEWYSYIFGEHGVFTNHSFIDENYDNVDAILLCTPVCGLRAWELYKNVNVWKLEETINLLFFDPRKENTDKANYYFEKGIDLFGPLTRSFLVFQRKLDEKYKATYSRNNVGDFGKLYCRFKELDLRICSAFLESLLEKESKGK